MLHLSYGKVHGSVSDNEYSRLLKRLLFFLLNLRSINEHEQIREEIERNDKLNSVDFYNFDRKIVFKFLPYLNLIYLFKDSNIDIYLFKASNIESRTRCEICSKLTKTSKLPHWHENIKKY